MSKQFKLTGKSQVTVPHDVRKALGVGPGASVSYEIDGDRVVMRAGDTNDADARIAAFAARLDRARKATATVPLGMTVDAYMALVREPVPVPRPDDLR